MNSNTTDSQPKVLFNGTPAQFCNLAEDWSKTSAADDVDGSFSRPRSMSVFDFLPGWGGWSKSGESKITDERPVTPDVTSVVLTMVRRTVANEQGEFPNCIVTATKTPTGAQLTVDQDAATWPELEPVWGALLLYLSGLGWLGNAERITSLAAEPSAQGETPEDLAELSAEDFKKRQAALRESDGSPKTEWYSLVFGFYEAHKRRGARAISLELLAELVGESISTIKRRKKDYKEGKS